MQLLNCISPFLLAAIDSPQQGTEGGENRYALLCKGAANVGEKEAIQETGVSLNSGSEAKLRETVL